MALEAAEIKEKLAALRRELYKKKKKLERLEQCNKLQKQLKTQKIGEIKLDERSSVTENRLPEHSNYNNESNDNKSIVKSDLLQQKKTFCESVIKHENIKSYSSENSECSLKQMRASKSSLSSSNRILQQAKCLNKIPNRLVSENKIVNDDHLDTSSLQNNVNVGLDANSHDKQKLSIFKVPTILPKKNTNIVFKGAPIIDDHSISEGDNFINSEHCGFSSEVKVLPSSENPLKTVELFQRKESGDNSCPSPYSPKGLKLDMKTENVAKTNTFLGQSSLDSVALSKTANSSIYSDPLNSQSSQSLGIVVSNNLHSNKYIENTKEKIVFQNKSSTREEGDEVQIQPSESMSCRNFSDLSKEEIKQMSMLSLNKQAVSEINIKNQLLTRQHCHLSDENKCETVHCNQTKLAKLSATLKECELKNIQHSDSVGDPDIENFEKNKTRPTLETEITENLNFFSKSLHVEPQQIHNVDEGDKDKNFEVKLCNSYSNKDNLHGGQVASDLIDTSQYELIEETNVTGCLLNNKFKHFNYVSNNETLISGHLQYHTNCLKTKEPVLAVHLSEMSLKGQKCVILITCLPNKIVIWKQCTSQWKIVEEMIFKKEEEQYFIFLEEEHWIAVIILGLLGSNAKVQMFSYGVKSDTDQCHLNNFAGRNRELKHSLLFCCLSNLYIAVTSTALLSPLWILTINNSISVPKFGLSYELPSAPDELINLLPIDNLDVGLLAYSSSSLYIWNVKVKQLVRTIERTPSNLYSSFLWASSESGRLYLLQKPVLNSSFSLIAINPVTGHSTHLHEFQNLKPHNWNYLNEIPKGSVDKLYFMITNQNSIQLWNILSSQQIVYLQSTVKISSSCQKLTSAYQQKSHLLIVGLQNCCTHIFSLKK